MEETTGFFDWDCPGVDEGSGSDRMLRTSEAEAAMIVVHAEESSQSRAPLSTGIHPIDQ